jgi:predicted dehydrogenase
MKTVTLGIIGCGYWGPNLLRNFMKLPDCRIKRVSDLKPGRLEWVRDKFPDVETTQDYREILNDEEIEAVCIVTPVSTHAPIAKEAMLAGKDVFVEKPLADSVRNSADLVQTAANLSRVLMVGQVYQYSPAVLEIQRVLQKDTARVFYVNAMRMNQGVGYYEVSVIWDLAPHDLAIAYSIMGKMPRAVSAIGRNYTGGRQLDMAYIQAEWSDGQLAHIHVSWLSPERLRLLQVATDKHMISFDDSQPVDKVRISGKGIDNRLTSGDRQVVDLGFKHGEILTPPLSKEEPLASECAHFLDCVRHRTKPLTDGEFGYDVVRMLEAAQSSAEYGGAKVLLA